MDVDDEKSTWCHIHWNEMIIYRGKGSGCNLLIAFGWERSREKYNFPSQEIIAQRIFKHLVEIQQNKRFAFPLIDVSVVDCNILNKALRESINPSLSILIFAASWVEAL